MMPSKSSTPVLTIEFIRDKETPGTVKFKEVPAAGGQPLVGTLYVKKAALSEGGKGIDRATVTIELH